MAKLGADLLANGYVLFNDPSMDTATVEMLAKTSVDNICTIMLRGQTDLELLINKKLRTRIFTVQDPLEIYYVDPVTNRWTKLSRYSPETGYIPLYFGQSKMRLHLNKHISDTVSHLYSARAYRPSPKETELSMENTKLVSYLSAAVPKPVGYTHGLGRLIVKILNTPDSLALLDSPLDAPNGRLETIFCSQINTTTVLRDSGGFECIPRFHLYYDILDYILWDQELFPDIKTSPLFNADTPRCRTVELSSRFDAMLQWLNSQLEMYTKIYNAAERDMPLDGEYEIRDELSSACEAILHQNNGVLPWCPEIFEPLKWELVPLKPGQAFVRDTRLPYRSLRNKSDTLFIAHHLPLYEIQDGYYLSNLHTAVRTEITSANCTRTASVIESNEIERRWMLQQGTSIFDAHNAFFESLNEAEQKLLCLRPYEGLKRHSSATVV